MMLIIQNFLNSLRVVDIIDVIILSFLIYQIILLIQGTRAFQMLTGFFLLIGVYYLSQFFQLNALSWALQRIFDSAVLILIIIFQSDIRSALTAFGKTNWFRKEDKQANIWGEIIRAVEYFSKERIGALLVFERDIGLKNFTQSAVNIDCNITYDMLLTIFSKSSPLHDGASIISNNFRIEACKCILPLSTKEQPKNRGTRHRAALGICEVSDAVVIVVSEESGKISFITPGKQYFGINSNQLLNIIYQYFGLQKTKATPAY